MPAKRSSWTNKETIVTSFPFPFSNMQMDPSWLASNQIQFWNSDSLNVIFCTLALSMKHFRKFLCSFIPGYTLHPICDVHKNILFHLTGYKSRDYVHSWNFKSRSATMYINWDLQWKQLHYGEKVSHNLYSTLAGIPVLLGMFLNFP